MPIVKRTLIANAKGRCRQMLALLDAVERRPYRGRRIGICSPELSPSELELLDKVDCDLERCRVWLERLAEG